VPEVISADSIPPPTCATPEAASPTAPVAPRDRIFDILKGLSILEVVVHHVLAASMRKYTSQGAWDWWLMAAANRVLHFAVPTFLLVSALLLAKSLSRKERPDWKRFFRRRTIRTLLPYLVWTAIYLGFRLLIARIDTDVRIQSTVYPLIGAVAVPRMLGWEHIIAVVLAGKAYFHLYFLAIMLQLAVAFPWLFAGARLIRGGFGMALAVGAALQIGAFLIQASILRLTYPASTLLWYLLPVCIGLWIGLHWSAWHETWRRWRRAICAITLTGFCVYFTLEVRQMTGASILSFTYNLSATTYATGIALILLAAAGRLARTQRTGLLLARLGDWSLPIFLIHPLALYLMGGPSLTRAIASVPLSPLWLFMGVAAITWLVSAATMRPRFLRSVLYGR
jgi:peptidoglycan/LPS O-acetylase OafA/YrhL